MQLGRCHPTTVAAATARDSQPRLLYGTGSWDALKSTGSSGNDELISAPAQALVGGGKGGVRLVWPCLAIV